MNHKVQDVQQLYDDAKKLYENVVLGKADDIINNLNLAINSLKNSWEGKDAGIQINNVIDVYNAMTKIRNALAALAKDSSSVAVGYREIQNANRANLEVLMPLSIQGELSTLEPYQDNRDTINITSEATSGKSALDNVNNLYEEFKSEVRRYYEAIMGNWQMGNGRGNADSAFGEFMASSDRYKSILEDVSRSIDESLKRYA